MHEKARGSLILPVKGGFLFMQMLSVGKLGLSKCLSSDCEVLQMLGPCLSIAERNSFLTLEPISPFKLVSQMVHGKMGLTWVFLKFPLRYVFTQKMLCCSSSP